MEAFKQIVTLTETDGDQGENQRRSELSRCVCRPLTTFALVDILLSSLEEIEKGFRALVARGAVARFFVGTAKDFVEAARLFEQFQEVITHYQVSDNCLVPWSTTHIGVQMSQRQTIHDQITNPTPSSMARQLPPERQTIRQSAKTALEIATVALEPVPPIGVVIGAVNQLIKCYEVVVEWVAIANH